MATLGSLAVNIVARTEKFTQGISKAMGGLGDLTKKAAMAAKAVGVVTGAVTASAAALAGYATALRHINEPLDKLAKTSDKLGIASERLAGLRHAAELTGVASNTLDMALQRMVRRVAEAAQGLGEARGALQELNIDARALNKLSPDKQFARIAERMSLVSTQSDKVRLAFKLFDSEGVSLVNTLALGGEGLAKMQAEAERLGIAFGRDALRGVESFNDEYDRLKKAAGGTVQGFSIDVGPQVEAVMRELRWAIEWWNKQQANGRKPSAGMSDLERRANLQGERNRERDRTIADRFRPAVNAIRSGLGDVAGQVGSRFGQFGNVMSGLKESYQKKQVGFLLDGLLGRVPIGTPNARLPKAATDAITNLGKMFGQGTGSTQGIVTAAVSKMLSVAGQITAPESQRLRLTGAMREGSAEARSTILATRFGSNKPEEKVAKNTSKANELLGGIKQGIDALAENFALPVKEFG